ncbi:hypothetical protein CEUSTIGMA_g3841.t1 [Chlamydomonas eustigma]|uniref:Proteasome maturation protein n=1 Tax=Chlamydomonas eustigma TaxID=1157962 RepID=A0A250X015_9CHLO|nr:hypothetical protein CEUSTIGMA_g3841.t1 [Chlamydomonas eustigma]|eukprot:GAX76396.1 hypothetical protein CEUSTIGMA_g3841.t1 [Chlamydomonas eustigma]
MEGSMAMGSLPFKTQAHDAMRMGLASLKEDALLVHPVEKIQEERKLLASEDQLGALRHLYGIAVPAKLQIETQILSQFGRLPGLPSSKLGLEALTGELDEFSFNSYLGLPENLDAVPVDMHSQMEQALRLGTKPMARGMM